jgi:hypothetical protein
MSWSFVVITRNLNGINVFMHTAQENNPSRVLIGTSFINAGKICLEGIEGEHSNKPESSCLG